MDINIGDIFSGIGSIAQPFASAGANKLFSPSSGSIGGTTSGGSTWSPGASGFSDINMSSGFNSYMG